jgi:hypothetical protein
MDARGIADAELTDHTHRSSLDELTNWHRRPDSCAVGAGRLECGGGGRFGRLRQCGA